MATPFPTSFEKAKTAWQTKPQHRLEWVGRMVEKKRWDVFTQLGTEEWPLDVEGVDSEVLEKLLEPFQREGVFKRLSKLNNPAIFAQWERLAPLGYQQMLEHERRYLVYPILKERAETLLHYFIDKKVLDPSTSPSQSGGSFMHLAATLDWPEIIPVLHEKYGLDPNQKNIKGNPPLHQGAWRSSGEVVFALVQAGANVHLQNDYGKVALVNASLGTDGTYGEAMAPNQDYIKALVASGADIHVRTGKTDRSPLLLEKVTPEIKEVLEIAFEKFHLHQVLEEASSDSSKPSSRTLRL